MFKKTLASLLLLATILPAGLAQAAAYTPVRGQAVDITKVSLNPATFGAILADLRSVSPQTLGISIFGNDYTVDISSARLLNANNAPVTYQSLVVGHGVTVVGRLDATNPMLVHAATVRDFGLTSVSPPVGSGLSCSGPTTAAVNAAVTFTASGVSGPFAWIPAPGVASGSNYTLAFSTAGLKTVAVTAGLETGTCLINISATGTGQLILPENLFRLSAEERVVFTPPDDSWTIPSPFHGYTGPSNRSMWNAFNTGSFPATIDPSSGPQKWYTQYGNASQNQGMLWQGTASLSWALRGDVAQYEIAAGKALQLLALDKLQGHQRHESLGYGGYWSGPVAAMAMAGLYAPAGSTSGPQLLAAAREWWADHITVLRSIRMPDGQVGILGSRQGSPFDASEGDLWLAADAAILMQLADPLPYASLHPAIKSLVSENGTPKNENYRGMTAHWYRPLSVHLWVTLRAIQSGALLPVPSNHAMPAVGMDVYRWTANGRTYIATPAVCGYSPWRWQVSWAPGEVLRVDAAIDPGSGGKGPNPAPSSVHIPSTATHLFGPAGPATQCDYR